MCDLSAKFDYFFIWLAGKIWLWGVADFLAIFGIFRQKIWTIFVQHLDQCLVHKKSCKNPFNIVYCPKFIFLVVEVVCTSSGCFNLVETLYLVRLQ